MRRWPASRGASVVVVVLGACTAIPIVLANGGKASAEQRAASSCVLSGSNKLAQPLRVYASCLEGGGDVSALPAGADILIDEYPTACPRSKAAVRFEGRWFYVDAALLRESLSGCSSDREQGEQVDQAAEVLARACLRGELDACRELRRHEKRAAAAALEASSSQPSNAHEDVESGQSDDQQSTATDPIEQQLDQDAERAEGEDESERAGDADRGSEHPEKRFETLPPAPVITKTSCALRSEASLYGQLLIRLSKGRRCQRVAQEPPYFRVICDTDEGWAIADCFDLLPPPASGLRP